MSQPADLRMEAGQPYPLGATWTGDGVNFAVFSAHATRIEVCLFDDVGHAETARLELPECTDEVWHGFLPGAQAGLVYGLRAHGPYVPEEGHRFNPNKLLLDPYATELVGRLRWGPSLFGYDMRHRREPGGGFDRRDSASSMLKARVSGAIERLQPPATPRVAWPHTVIYEAHVRGLTRLHGGVPEAQRGYFGGLASPAMIQHLKSLGVTSVELLPVHGFLDDAHLLDRGLRNYWGYNSLAFFAPEPRYLGGAGVASFREMVARLHDAGIEVLLDVVYNHTAEGNELGPTLSFKGLDNASYYRLAPERRHYINDTGTGNTLNQSHPRVVQLVLDSLRHWVHMGVDGFRFDLATVLGREDAGFDQGCGFFDACRQDPVLNRVKLIAEPWDCGPGGYQPGNFPPGWAEWNDSFRDTVRAFWRGDEAQAADLATRLTGSAESFNHRGRRPWASVNFITAHDGFTLHDLVSYNDKHNHANGEENRDGHSDNRSWNCGAEGATDDPAVLTLRARQQRNLLATLLLAQGTPMLLAGDELGHSQQGNNNAYCQDNPTSWIDWTGLQAASAAQLAYVRRLLRLRRLLPVLRPARFATGGDPAHTLRDVIWLDPNAQELSPEAWDDPLMRSLGMLADGRAHLGAGPEPNDDMVTLLILNASHVGVDWTLPPVAGVTRWTRLISTELEEPETAPDFAVGECYTAGPRSLLLFAAAPDAADDAIAALVKQLDGEG